MTERSYKIQMRTPLGIKHGLLQMRKAGDQISGYLSVMKHSEPFRGTIEANGYCRFSGRMITLLNVIEYTASGYMDSEYISLLLEGGHNMYQITGMACLEGEEES